MEDTIFTAEASLPENASASPPLVLPDENAQSVEHLQSELQALKNAFSEFARQNMPEIEQVKQQLRSATAERDNVAGELEKLRRQMTVITVSHDLGFVNRETDLIICVNRSVNIHNAADFTAETANEVYHHHVSMIKHDHACFCHCGKEHEEK